jgi:hypothetical protein
MRMILATLMCISLLFQGTVSAHACAPHCPMHDSGMVMTPGVDRTHDGCHDADTAAKTGKRCKTGQDCQVVHPLILPATVTLSPAPATPLFIPTAGHLFPSSDPTGVWRPPTQS